MQINRTAQPVNVIREVQHFKGLVAIAKQEAASYLQLIRTRRVARDLQLLDHLQAMY